MLLWLFVLTCTVQMVTSIGDAVKREIGQGLVEGHGVDKGVAVAGACTFYDFETCEEIDLSNERVRCMCVVTRAVYSVAHLSSTFKIAHAHAGLPQAIVDFCMRRLSLKGLLRKPQLSTKYIAVGLLFMVACGARLFAWC